MKYMNYKPTHTPTRTEVSQLLTRVGKASKPTKDEKAAVLAVASPPPKVEAITPRMVEAIMNALLTRSDNLSVNLSALPEDWFDSADDLLQNVGCDPTIAKMRYRRT